MASKMCWYFKIRIWRQLMRMAIVSSPRHSLSPRHRVSHDSSWTTARLLDLCTRSSRQATLDPWRMYWFTTRKFLIWAVPSGSHCLLLTSSQVLSSWLTTPCWVFRHLMMALTTCLSCWPISSHSKTTSFLAIGPSHSMICCPSVQE